MIDNRYISNKISSIVSGDRVIYFINSEEDLEKLNYFKKLLSKYENIKFTIGVKNKDLQNKIKYLSQDEVIYLYDEEALAQQFDVVLFTSAYSRDIFIFSKYKPKFLFGNIDGNFVDYYEVWRKYRTIVDEMYLHIWTEYKTFEVLDWKAGEYEVELSIILPIYNVEKYLDKCLSTILDEKEMDYIEVLGVNDGSPDNSDKLIEEYSSRDSRVKLINKENGGCASARKKGLEVAKGRFVAFVDPDDFVTKDAFHKLHRRILLNSYDFVLGGYYEYYENTKDISKIYERCLEPVYNYGTTDKVKVNDIIFNGAIAMWRGIYRKSFLEVNNINFNENFRRFDDLPFMMEVAAKANSCASIPDHIYYYRLERPGQDVAIDDERLYVQFDIFDYLDEKITLGLDDEKINDRLQIRRIACHNWAIEKLRDEFVDDYKKRAKKDMIKNSTHWNNILLMWRYKGRKGILSYMKFMFR